MKDLIEHLEASGLQPVIIDENTIFPAPVDDYADATPLQWAEYEFASIEYDYKIHPRAAEAIRAIFARLSK